MLASLFYALALAGSFVFDWAVDWRARQDPRQRLLWDTDTSQAQIVILGDSVLVSSFVDTASESLATVLERRTGKRVFNGSLTGADPADFLKAARLLEKNGTRTATVILDVMPTRFFQKKRPDPAAGNYPGQFARLLGDNLPGKWLAVLVRPLLILNPDILIDLALQKEWYGVGEYRNRVWNRDGYLARARFERFEKQVLDSEALRDFDWIVDVDGILKRNNNKLIVLITPVNSWLIRDYASRERAEKYLSRLSRSRQALVAFLNQKNIDYIDGTNHAHSEDFVDLVHPNAGGDGRLAELIASYLASPRGEIASDNKPHM